MGLDYKILYKKGYENHVADALSRKVQTQPDNGTTMVVTELIPSWIEKLKENYHGDKWAQERLRSDNSSQVMEEVLVHHNIIRVK
jgi:hypothetical protein